MKKENITIVENENLQENLKKLQELGYKYIVKAQDNFLSGWGCGAKKHLQLIACKDSNELDTIKRDLYNDNTMKYVNWWFINDKAIINATRNKSYTIRNDWTRCF